MKLLYLLVHDLITKTKISVFPFCFNKKIFCKTFGTIGQCLRNPMSLDCQEISTDPFGDLPFHYNDGRRVLTLPTSTLRSPFVLYFIYTISLLPSETLALDRRRNRMWTRVSVPCGFQCIVSHRGWTDLLTTCSLTVTVKHLHCRIVHLLDLTLY